MSRIPERRLGACRLLGRDAHATLVASFRAWIAPLQRISSCRSLSLSLSLVGHDSAFLKTSPRSYCSFELSGDRLDVSKRLATLCFTLQHGERVLTQIEILNSFADSAPRRTARRRKVVAGALSLSLSIFVLASFESAFAPNRMLCGS